MKNIFFIPIILLLSLIVYQNLSGFGVKLKAQSFKNSNTPYYINKPKKYALLIGGGSTQFDNYDFFYQNILYVKTTLKRMGYKDQNIKLLYNSNKKKDPQDIENIATKSGVVKMLNHLKDIVDLNDSLLIFRSGHGIIKLIFEKYGILPKDKTISDILKYKVIGTSAVMIFPDGYLSSIELQKELDKIKCKQLIVILNQCYAGEFTNIALNLKNTVIITETSEVELAFILKKKNQWEGEVWPFVKCLCDGFIGSRFNEKRSISEAYEYMLKCHPGVGGIPTHPDRPLWKVTPKIEYGKGLSKGYVFLN